LRQKKEQRTGGEVGGEGGEEKKRGRSVNHVEGWGKEKHETEVRDGGPTWLEIKRALQKKKKRTEGQVTR